MKLEGQILPNTSTPHHQKKSNLLMNSEDDFQGRFCLRQQKTTTRITMERNTSVKLTIIPSVQIKFVSERFISYNKSIL